MRLKGTGLLPALAALAGALCAAPAVADGLAGAQRVSVVQPAAENLPVADRVLVLKGERRLQLLRHGQVLREYKIALGLNPVGHKERSGDFRTPEGNYVLTRRNPRSDYFLSIQVSYPSAADTRHARRNGWDAGGAIMIHGLPNELKRTPEYYERTDWTDGCIAVSNADMLEIWLLTPDHVPIDIRP
ncbi:MAG: murein L,D-transpeptidase family protein [Steroidobacteraceae bacterium]